MQGANGRPRNPPLSIAPTRRGRQTFEGIKMPDIVSPAQVAEALNELWSPRVVAELDDSYVKVAKVQGTLAWHSHETEDELLYILKGSLTIEMEDRTVVLREGETFVVPKGVRHNPVAEQECHIMLIERKRTLHTGDQITAKTRSITEQLRPI
jgi:mannose-6-phosphate isomerase-like protein (cupin superfamily)